MFSRIELIELAMIQKKKEVSHQNQKGGIGLALYHGKTALRDRKLKAGIQMARSVTA